MTARHFVDTNIWFYALTDSPFPKKDQANGLLDSLQKPYINGQVIRELAYNLKKKAGYSENALQEVFRQLHLDCFIVPDEKESFLLASRLRMDAGFSYWDSLIVAAALVANCDTLYSEDMQHGQVVTGSMTIINPLRTENP